MPDITFKPRRFTLSKDAPMHSHDRTMLAKLGFADRDKGDPRHDLACEFLLQEDAILNLLDPQPCEPSSGYDDPYWAPFDFEYVRNGKRHSVHEGDEMPEGFKIEHRRARGGFPKVTHVCIERPLSKGTGQYKTTVGFLDVAGSVHHPALIQFTIKAKPSFKATGVVDCGEDRSFIIEVKTSPVGVGDIIRQMKLYREYTDAVTETARRSARLDDHDNYEPPPWSHPIHWAVVTDFDLDDGAIDVLEREGIKYARLGPKFEAWIKTRSKAPSKKRQVL